jgi:hypothetical protein
MKINTFVADHRRAKEVLALVASPSHVCQEISRAAEEPGGKFYIRDINAR